MIPNSWVHHGRCSNINGTILPTVYCDTTAIIDETKTFLPV